MTIPFFQSVDRLRGMLVQTLDGLAAQSTATALEELRRLPDFSELESLRRLTEPAQIVNLLFHDDRFDAVASRLGLPPDSRRAVFGAETRACRLLPPGPARTRLGDILLQALQNTFDDAAGVTLGAWKGSKVRRIAPRTKGPIDYWSTQRSLPIRSIRLVVESYAGITEFREGVEEYTADFRLKIVDWEGRRLTLERVHQAVRGTSSLIHSTIQTSDASFYGVLPDVCVWQMWWNKGNLGVVFSSFAFHRKNPKFVENFFQSARDVSLDLLGLLLTVS